MTQVSRILWIVRFILLCSLCAIGSSCSTGGNDPEVYVIDVYVVGEATSFAGRTIHIQGQTAPDPKADGEASIELGKAVVRTSVSLCTFSRTDFFEAPISITVEDADGHQSESSVERVACRLSPDRGKERLGEEENYLWLNDDGTIDSDFGTGYVPSANCSTYLDYECKEEAFQGD